MTKPDDRQGIFAGADPFQLAKNWLDEASEQEIADPNAIALATADASGMPNVRIVLLKSIEDDAFVFYTNYDGTKGQELQANPKAAFTMHWKTLQRQVRARGLIEKEDGEIADAYYQSRALQSRLGAWASQQSRPLASREALMADVEAARQTHGETPPRPPFWGGFRLRPLEIEFWAEGDFRLHDRYVWRRASVQDDWEIQRLSP
ncbi:MAG: pyridoxamine 5'-phosphate oxidase [Pseudomonadota bacterium]